MKNKMKKNKLLILELQKALAGEGAAYHAYIHHARSMKNLEESNIIEAMMYDELDHVIELEEMLDDLGAEPNLPLCISLSIVGRVAGYLCYISGRKVGLCGAMLIERYGGAQYEKMAELAVEAGHIDIGVKLMAMHEVEVQHERLLKEMLDK